MLVAPMIHDLKEAEDERHDVVVDCEHSIPIWVKTPTTASIVCRIDPSKLS